MLLHVYRGKVKVLDLIKALYYLTSSKKKEEEEMVENTIVRYFERYRGHIHITFTMVYCHNCSIVLLVIIVNLTVPNL